MDKIIETLSISLSLVALFVIFFVVLFNIYFLKRNGFYINVNCWFCNSWTKVIYADRNSFDCPTCLQYNGFNDDGGYNKIIKAQHDTSCNKNKTSIKTERLVNGLCTFCNNNQQLKVYQLANFVPLNEENYEKEVEHFQKQLEKAYKLCRKCDKVLKTTIEKQYAWIFGNHLKNLRKKGFSLLDLNKSSHGYTKESKQSFCLKFMKYTLIIFHIVIIFQTLNVKINYSNEYLKKLVPKNIVPYTVIFNDFCNAATLAATNISSSFKIEVNELNSYLPKNIAFRANNLAPITFAGIILQIVLLVFDNRSSLWQVNELFAIIILFTTSIVSFSRSLFLYLQILQVFCSTFVIISLLSTNKPNRKKEKTDKKRKLEFKKLNKRFEYFDSSDADEDLNTSTFSTQSKKSNKSYKGLNDFDATHCQSRESTPLDHFNFQNSFRNTANLNKSFSTARSTNTTSVFNGSVYNNNLHSELNRSLDNLHLSKINFKPQTSTPPIFSVSTANRPILSPAKLKNITQNSWAAGGFWKNDIHLLPASTEFANLSRSSSQSSGFVSNSNEMVNNNIFSSLPPSREPSMCGDFERNSILSEPAYHFDPINSKSFNSGQQRNSALHNFWQMPRTSIPPNSNISPQLYYKAENNTFYPVLSQNNMLFIQGSSIPHYNFESSFSNLSLQGFNTNKNRFSTPPLFGERPVTSSLFKNLHGASGYNNFRKPQC